MNRGHHHFFPFTVILYLATQLSSISTLPIFALYDAMRFGCVMVTFVRELHENRLAVSSGCAVWKLLAKVTLAWIVVPLHSSYGVGFVKAKVK